MPEILGTHKKSQTINHNLPQKIVITKVRTFSMTTCWGDDRIGYLTKTNHFNRLCLVAFAKSIWEYLHYFIFFLIDYLSCYFETFSEGWFFFSTFK